MASISYSAGVGLASRSSRHSSAFAVTSASDRRRHRLPFDQSLKTAREGMGVRLRFSGFLAFTRSLGLWNSSNDHSFHEVCVAWLLLLAGIVSPVALTKQ